MDCKHPTQDASETNHQVLTADGVAIPKGVLIPMELFSDFILGLVNTDQELRELVLLRFLGLSYKEIGLRLGVSTQLAEMRHKRAMRDWPAFAAFFPDKVARQSRRKGRA